MRSPPCPHPKAWHNGGHVWSHMLLQFELDKSCCRPAISFQFLTLHCTILLSHTSPTICTCQKLSIFDTENCCLVEGMLQILNGNSWSPGVQLTQLSERRFQLSTVVLLNNTNSIICTPVYSVRQKVTFHGSDYPKEISHHCTTATHRETVHCQRVF